MKRFIFVIGFILMSITINAQGKLSNEDIFYIRKYQERNRLQNEVDSLNNLCNNIDTVYIEKKINTLKNERDSIERVLDDIRTLSKIAYFKEITKSTNKNLTEICKFFMIRKVYFSKSNSVGGHDLRICCDVYNNKTIKYIHVDIKGFKNRVNDYVYDNISRERNKYCRATGPYKNEDFVCGWENVIYNSDANEVVINTISIEICKSTYDFTTIKTYVLTKQEIEKMIEISYEMEHSPEYYGFHQLANPLIEKCGKLTEEIIKLKRLQLGFKISKSTIRTNSILIVGINLAYPNLDKMYIRVKEKEEIWKNTNKYINIYNQLTKTRKIILDCNKKLNKKKDAEEIKENCKKLEEYKYTQDTIARKLKRIGITLD